jgi:uncharacterized membrane protein
MTGQEYNELRAKAKQADNGAEVVEITKDQLRELLKNWKYVFFTGCLLIWIVVFLVGTFVEHASKVCP